MLPSKIFPRSLIASAFAASFSVSAFAVYVPVLAATAEAQFQTSTFQVEDVERSNSLTVVGPIKAEYAYARGLTGKGVTVAVLDTGINATHREFFETGKLVQGFDATTGLAGAVDNSGHGTHVAGILAASRSGTGIFGAAYGAQLLSIKVLDATGSGSTTYLDNGLRYAIGKAPIANMSLTATSAYQSRALQDAVRAGMLIVAAAGNSGGLNPEWPARYAKEAWANNQIIAVGAVDGDNRIASFSNRAGDTGAWFIVAPGVRVMSSYLSDKYMYMSGTSMATPVVSGAAALIKQLWPALRADEIANILFITATDLGAPGIDEVYGRGLLNVEKALQPVGTITTTTYNGRTISVLDSALKPSTATSRLWSMAASGNLRIIGLDDFKRDFNVDLSAAVAKPSALSIEQVFDSMNRRIEVADNLLANGSRLFFVYEQEAAMNGAEQRSSQSDRSRLAAFALVSKSTGGTETALGIGGLAANQFGAGALEVGQSMSLGAVPALSNPYLELVPMAAHAAIAQRIGGFKVKAGMLSSGLNQLIVSQEGPYLPATLSNAPKANSAVLELSKTLDDLAMSLSFSQTREAGAYLGTQSSGALSLGANAGTTSVQLAAALMLAPKLALAAQASYGFTPANTGMYSLISEVTSVRTNAFSLALVASDQVKPGDRLSFALSQPMRTYSGQLVMDVMTGVDATGTAKRDRLLFSMVPTGRELRGELNYQTPLGKNATAGVTFLVRRDPNHISDAPTEKLLAMRYTKQF